jgi:hypothetical protein
VTAVGHPCIASSESTETTRVTRHGTDEGHREHLKRKHSQPNHRCNRCWRIFKSEFDLEEHQRSQVSCEVKQGEPGDYLTDAQLKRLRSRKKGSSIMTESDKWRAAYRIIFPDVTDDNVPSPC